MSLMTSLKIGYGCYRSFQPYVYKFIRLNRNLILPSNHLTPLWIALGKCHFLIESSVAKVLDNREYQPLSTLTIEQAKKRGPQFIDSLIFYGILAGFPIFDILKAKKDGAKKGKELNDKLNKIKKEIKEQLGEK